MLGRVTVRPARSLLIEHVGRWWLGHERGWTLRVPAAEGVADVEYVVAYDWGLGKRIPVVPSERDACGSLHHHHADNAGARRGFPPGTATEGAAHLSAARHIGR